MGYNLNFGWGRLVANSLMNHLAARPHTGKVLIVCASTHVNWEELNEIFPPTDKVRVVDDLQEAIDLCTSNEDDVIFVTEGHTENIASAAAINANKTGISIIGLGQGRRRPVFSFITATTADFEVDNASVYFENIVFDLTGIDALNHGLDVDARDCKFKNCEFITADTDGQALTAIVTDANAGGLQVEDCYFHGTQVAGSTTAIRIVGGLDHKIKNSTFIGNYKLVTGAISVTTTAAGIEIKDCDILNATPASTGAMDFVANSTTIITGCVLGIRSGTTPIHIDEAGTFDTGEGYNLIGRNYYHASTPPVAGTLL
mgnify:CR=1 FL=1